MADQPEATRRLRPHPDDAQAVIDVLDGRLTEELATIARLTAELAALREENGRLLRVEEATRRLCGALSLWRPGELPEPQDYTELIYQAWNETADAITAFVVSLPPSVTPGEPEQLWCHANSDGECDWSECPQEANNRANWQRICPLVTPGEET